MKRNAWIAAIAAALLSTAAMAQWGPGPGNGPGSGYGRMGAGMQGAPGFGQGCGLRAEALDALGLTADQRTRIAAIQDENHAQRLALMDEMHELRSLAFRSGNPDYAAMAAVRERMFALARQARERIDAVLTAEQRDRLHSGWRGFGPRG